MALMPKGQPRSVPDTDSEDYNAMIREHRARQNALEQAPRMKWAGSPARSEAADAMAATPMDLEALKYFPVIGPILDSVEDFGTGHPWLGVGDGVSAVVDAGLVATGVGVGEAFAKGVANNSGKQSARAVARQLRRKGVAGRGQEIHHSIELNGIKRNVENWRNHPAFLKVLSKADHRRIRGSWGGLPRFDPITRTWVGTPDWMKTTSAWLTDQAGKAVGQISLAAPSTRHASQPPMARDL